MRKNGAQDRVDPRLNDPVERLDKSLERLEQGERDLRSEMRELRTNSQRGVGDAGRLLGSGIDSCGGCPWRSASMMGLVLGAAGAVESPLRGLEGRPLGRHEASVAAAFAQNGVLAQPDCHAERQTRV
jgi:hypothetical protein